MTFVNLKCRSCNECIDPSQPHAYLHTESGKRFTYCDPCWQIVKRIISGTLEVGQS